MNRPATRSARLAGSTALAVLLIAGGLAAPRAHADQRPHTVITEEVRQEVTVSRHSVGPATTPPPAPAATEMAPPPPPGAVVAADVPPPPPRVEQPVGQPAPEYRWVPGHWSWENGAWAWTPGTWEQPPQQSAEWVPGRWEQRPDGWQWIPGYWS